MPRPTPSLPTLRTKHDAVQVFVRQPSPQIIAAGLATVLARRVRDRRVDRRDVAVVAAVALTQGLHEWVIHRHLLHAPPRAVRGAVLDPGAGHRAHHEHPEVIDDALLKPADATLFLGMIGGYVALTCLPWRRHLARRNTLTAVAAAYAALLAYEWTHYIDHTSVPLRGPYARHLRAHHRLHHYRDERAWLGITSATGDRLFRTRRATRSTRATAGQRGSQITRGMSRSVFAWYSS